MHVLIVDDSHFMTKTIARILFLEHPDWTCQVAHDAEQALKFMETHRYDYVTVDYNMPGDNGSVVILAAKGKYSESKVALLTANKQKSMLERAKDLGVVFIPKPDFKDALIEFFKQV